MILKCPNCGEQYEIHSKEPLDGFILKCQSCGADISSSSEEIMITKLQHEGERTGIPSKPKSRWKWVVAVIVALLAVMLLTKPGKTMHTEKIRELALGIVSENVQAEDDDFTKGLAMLLGPFVINQFLESGLQVEDYLFFNVGRIKYNEVDKPITIGIFNCVYPLVKQESIAEKIGRDASND